MPYRVGNKGSYGCSGYPALKDDGTVMGCHKTRKAAMGQIYAINRSEGNIGKAMLKEGDFAMIGHKNEALVGQVVHVMTDGMLGVEGSDKAIMASPGNPAILIRLFEQEDSGYWEETSYFYGHSAAMFVAIDPLQTEPSMDAEVSKAESELFSARDVTKTQRLTEIFKRD